MGGRPPPGCWVPKQGPSPRPGQRMAQEAFEAYGKSSPLPALLHLPNPPGYVLPPVSMGTGGSRHGTLSTMRRRGDYRRGGNSGWCSWNAGPKPWSRAGRPKGKPPPRQPSASPRGCAVPTTCLRRACNGGEAKRAPHPPPTPPPPRGRMRVGRGRKAPPPPPPRTTRHGGEAEEGGCGTSHTTVPVEGARRASPGGGPPGERA